ncbi:MAG: DUF4388 domain-containing protein [Deltaproteobacteria bacterium]|nr:DUF4388 domain-containing protein [Nannocystaceae bacterium]
MPKVDVVAVGEDGSVTPEGNDARYRLRNSAGRYRIMSDTPGLLVLRRLLPSEETFDELDDLEELLTGESGPIGAGPRVVMAGEIISPMTLFQMIEIVAERGFVGDMHVFSSGGRHFLLSLDRGTLLHAHSNDPADRLGELMVRQGMIDRVGLDVMLGDVTGSQRLGRVCLERGVLRVEELFSLLGAQTSGIFLRTLTVSDGAYVFTTPDPSQPPPDHTVHLPVKALLMDGIRRLDEIELYRRLIPGNDVRLRARAGVNPTGLDADAMALLAHCDGNVTLGEAARLVELDEFASTRAAYFLVKRRCVEVISRDRFDEAEVRRVTEAFSAVLVDVFATIEAAGGLAQAQQMLGAWLDGSGYTAYLGDRAAIDGTVDPEVVLEAMRAAREDDPLATLLHVAHELVSFALFCAGSALNREQEMTLSKDVNARLEVIRRV